MAKAPLITPWTPASYTDPDVYALKALQAGEAEPHQQKRALDFIINVVCKTYDLSWQDDSRGGERATSFAEGKRFVGLQIVKFVNYPVSRLGKKDGRSSRNPGKPTEQPAG